MRSEKVDPGSRTVSLVPVSFLPTGHWCEYTCLYGCSRGIHKRLLFGLEYQFGSHLHIISKNSRNDIK
jgi:hypothetical protein